MKRQPNKCLFSLIEGDLPYHFLNKIEEVNAIIGEQQLEAIDYALNIIKNKNKISLFLYSHYFIF